MNPKNEIYYCFKFKISKYFLEKVFFRFSFESVKRSYKEIFMDLTFSKPFQISIPLLDNVCFA